MFKKIIFDFRRNHIGVALDLINFIEIINWHDIKSFDNEWEPPVIRTH